MRNTHQGMLLLNLSRLLSRGDSDFFIFHYLLMRGRFPPAVAQPGFPFDGNFLVKLVYIVGLEPSLLAAPALFICEMSCRYPLGFV